MQVALCRRSCSTAAARRTFSLFSAFSFSSRTGFRMSYTCKSAGGLMNLGHPKILKP